MRYRPEIAGFYGRRARRDLAADALAKSTYTINLRLAAQNCDYLRSDLLSSAFQQFWSRWTRSAPEWACWPSPPQWWACHRAPRSAAGRADRRGGGA